MPGSSRVGGTWRTVTGLSAKVGGQWKTATSGFVKVGGQWKQWFASKIQDAFNRASTALGLGTADSGQAWNALRGNWRISGSNTAISDDAASTYPLAAINLGNTDVKVQTDTTGGVGVAFWVTDAGSWWASYPTYTSTSSTTPINGFCYTSSRSVNVQRRGCYTQQSQNCDSYSTTSSGACSGPFGGGTACTGTSTCSCTGSSCTCTPSGCSAGCASTTCSDGGSSTSYFCSGNLSYCTGSGCTPSGCAAGCGVEYTSYLEYYSNGSPGGCCATYGQCSGTATCTEGTSSTRYEVNDGGSCFGLAGPGESVSQVSCSNCTGLGPCGSGGFVCCRITSSSTTATYSCSCSTSTIGNCLTSTTAVVTTTRNCSCGVLQNQPQYWYKPGSFSCNTGTSYCFGAGCDPGGCCSGIFDASYSTSVCDQGGASCTGSGCTPAGCCSTPTYSGGVTTTTYITNLVIVSSVSNTVVSAASTTISSNTTGYTNVGSVYVTTVGNAITATAYSGSVLGGSVLGTAAFNPSSPTKGTSVGIIKAPSSGSQGSTTDNFLATI